MRSRKGEQQDASEPRAAEQLHSLECQKLIVQEVDSVRLRVRGLMDTLQAAEVRAAQLEHMAKASQPIVGSASQAAVKEWLVGIVDRIEREVWLKLESQLEEKVRQVFESVSKDTR